MIQIGKEWLCIYYCHVSITSVFSSFFACIKLSLIDKFDERGPFRIFGQFKELLKETNGTN